LIDEHAAQQEKASEFYQRQDERNAERLAQDPSYNAKIRDFTGPPDFLCAKSGLVYTRLPSASCLPL